MIVLIFRRLRIVLTGFVFDVGVKIQNIYFLNKIHTRETKILVN